MQICNTARQKICRELKNVHIYWPFASDISRYKNVDIPYHQNSLPQESLNYFLFPWEIVLTSRAWEKTFLLKAMLGSRVHHIFKTGRHQKAKLLFGESFHAIRFGHKLIEEFSRALLDSSECVWFEKIYKPTLVEII